MNQQLSESAYDQSSGHRTEEPQREVDSAATGPKDTVTGAIQETPAEPSDRSGTEDGEGR
jgi:hypothetical protein